MTGSEGDAAWTEELRARRKLTRHPSAIRLRVRLVAYLIGSLVMGLGVALNTPPFRPDQWRFFVFFVGLAGLLIFTARCLWALYELLTGRPVLTIDLEGVELGRRNLEWVACAKNQHQTKLARPAVLGRRHARREDLWRPQISPHRRQARLHPRPRAVCRLAEAPPAGRSRP